MRHSAQAQLDRYELLLDGQFGDDALSRVLAAVTASGTQDELAGLAAARSAFVAQTSTAAPARAAAARRRPATSRTVAGRLLAAKAVAAVTGATLVGGVAYAATTTSLFRTPAPHHAPGAPAPQPTESGAPSGGGSNSTVGGGNGPASAVPAHPGTSKSLTPPGKANGHTIGGPTAAHGTPHNPPNPGHQPGVGSSASSSTPGHSKSQAPPKSPQPKPSHPAHPSQAHPPRNHQPV